MKLNISYRGARYVINVLPTDNVYNMKLKIEEVAQLSTSFITEAFTKSQANLVFNNTVLKDDMVVCDIGLVSGTSLQYKVMETQKCKLKITVKFLKQQVVELGDEIDMFTTTVGDCRVVLQNILGIPMSIFYLSQPGKEHELYDMHALAYYDIKEGDSLVLSAWKGTTGVIHGALKSDISKTMVSLPNFFENPTLNRYLLRCVLFTAAHNDDTKLAALVLQRGIRCEESVGEHSSRQWCSTQSHPGVFKTPIHQAAQMGSFNCLKMFVRHSPSSMICRDGYNMTPSNYASRHKKVECWKLLIASQFLHARIHGFTLASHARIMRWCCAAKERVSYFKGDGTKHSLLLHSTIGTNNNTYLGNEITVAGFVNTDQLDRKTKHQIPGSGGLTRKQSTLVSQPSSRLNKRNSIFRKSSSGALVSRESCRLTKRSSNMEHSSSEVKKDLKNNYCSEQSHEISNTSKSRLPKRHSTLGRNTRVKTPSSISQQQTTFQSDPPRQTTSKSNLRNIKTVKSPLSHLENPAPRKIDNSTSVTFANSTTTTDKNNPKATTYSKEQDYFDSEKPLQELSLDPKIDIQNIDLQNIDEREQFDEIEIKTDVNEQRVQSVDSEQHSQKRKTKKKKRKKKDIELKTKIKDQKKDIENNSISSNENERELKAKTLIRDRKYHILDNLSLKKDGKSLMFKLDSSETSGKTATPPSIELLRNERKPALVRSNISDNSPGNCTRKVNIKLPPMRRSYSIASTFNCKEQNKVQALILEATGLNSKDLASQCLELGETFNAKPWIRQFNIAIMSSTNRIKRGKPRPRFLDVE